MLTKREQLEALAKANLLRKNRVFDRSLINFSSNDYLGLSVAQPVKAAVQLAIERDGVGSGSSPAVCGYSAYHQEFELAFADFIGRERALLFSSGYLANIGAITALTQRSQTLLIDKDCHASILSGCQLSRAKVIRYRHQDLEHLSQCLKKYKPDGVISESVFSMEGRISPVVEIAALCREQGASLFIDNAHAIGVLDAHLVDGIDCVVTPLGKAFGAMGGMVSGSSDVIETILQFGSSYRYNTALPSATCAGLLAALACVKTETWRQEKLLELSAYFNLCCQQYGFELVSDDLTAIKAMIIADNAKVLSIQEKLLKRGFHVAAIRPPTVANNSSRLRISLSALHSKENINELFKHLREIYDQSF